MATRPGDLSEGGVGQLARTVFDRAERLESILELTGSFAFVSEVGTDGSVRLEWISDTFTRAIGYTVEELEAVGGPLTIVHPEDLPRAADVIQAIVAGENPGGGELRMVTRSGAIRWVRFHYTTESGPDAAGRLRLFGAGQDVTDEVAAREAASANAARLQAFFEHSPIGQLILSAEGTLLGVNPAFCELTGYSEDELVGTLPALVVDPGVLQRSEERFRRMLATGADRLDRESTWRSKEGRTIEVALTVVPERDTDGGIRQFVIAVQDVTERKRTYEELNRLATIVQSSDDAILALSLDGVVTSWNPGAERIYGYSKEEMVGSRIDTLIPPDRAGELLPTLRQVAAGASVRRLETKRIRKDGTIIDVGLSVSPIHDGSGTVVGASVMARDITAAKRAYEERQDLLERVVEAHAEERVRLARELHDGLGQVLTSASLYARSVEEEAPAALAASLTTLRGQLEEALAATRNLVWRLRPVEIDEEGLAGAVTTLAEKIRQRHHFQVEVHISGLDGRLPPPVESAIYRVVQEAVTNSVRHADPEAISIVITRRGPVILAVVEDDGAGFAPDIVLSRQDDSGFGILGMHERAASIGGQLVIESRPGNGTTVRLEAPRTGAGSR